ncbi:MAG: alpha/beta hydrolase [Mycobacterium sp.]
MTLTIADIERWDAGDVREVFHAASSRAKAVQDAANGLAQLPAFTTWGGEAAEAAKEAIGKTRADLDAHGQEALAVANAARSAADEIERIRSELATLKADAAALGMEIDPVSGQVVPGPGTSGNPMEVLIKQQQLQPRVDKLIAEANLVDMALANAIDMAGGSVPIPESPHASDPDVQAALEGGPLPEDPQEFNDFWDKLTDEQKELLYEQNPFIGNSDGMPFDDRHLFNERHLTELQQATQTELDRLRAAHPDWAGGEAPFRSTPEWQTWKPQWDAANKASNEYAQVRKALDSSDGIPRFLGVLDDQGRAAVSLNNPDDATRSATFVPGTGQDLGRFEFSADKSKLMYQATLNADRSLQPGDVSVATWMGYDRPMEVWNAASPNYAHNGAGTLQSFQDGLRASHDNVTAGGDSINTVIGHSYGSTIMGAAALDGQLDANNVVAVGSPGVLTDHASNLNLPDGAHVFATRAENDIIGAVTGATLGPDPMSGKFGAIPFEAAPGETWPFGLPSVDAHSSYWDNMNNPALINMGRIIAGRTDVTPPTFNP